MNGQGVLKRPKSPTWNVSLPNLAQFLVRPGEKTTEQAQFVERGEGRGVHGVAAEVAQEIGVLFQYDDVNAGPREQIAEHHAGRSAAHDATLRFDRRGRNRSALHHHVISLSRHTAGKQAVRLPFEDVGAEDAAFRLNSGARADIDEAALAPSGIRP